ncbi:hypothetical protein [Paenibacillus dokdonensis]
MTLHRKADRRKRPWRSDSLISQDYKTRIRIYAAMNHEGGKMDE